MTISVRNNTGTALTLYSGREHTLCVLANDQLGQGIPNAVTNVKLGNSSTICNRRQGNFVNGHAYAAAIVNANVQFVAEGQPMVIFG